MKLFISWRSASFSDLDGEFCIVAKQVLNWHCIAVSFVIHISHRLTLLLYRLKYELYRFRAGLYNTRFYMVYHGLLRFSNKCPFDFQWPDLFY